MTYAMHFSITTNIWDKSCDMAAFQNKPSRK